MNAVLWSFLVGSLGGPLGGIAAGVLATTWLRRVSDRTRGGMLSFAAGFILAVAFLELVARALKEARGWEVAMVLVGVAAGAAVRGVVSHLFEAGGEKSNSDGDQTAYGGGQARKIAWSLAVVNVVEGMTLGIGFAVGQRLGLLLAAVMIFENFMEGISVGTELARGKHRKRQVYWLTTAPTLTLGIGGALGAYLGGLSPLALTALLGAGAGIMFYVVVDDVVYDAHRLGPGAVTTLPFIVGVMAGIGVTAV